MVGKILARYFYTPICPESFASLDRLSSLFRKYKEHIHFESFNVFECKFESVYSWFPNEDEIIESIRGKESSPLLFGKLFIQGNEIKGFPPSKKSISDELEEYGISFKEEDYKLDYKSTMKKKLKYDINKFHIKQYDEKLLRDSCIICTKYNPYLDEEAYIPENWNKYEELKTTFLKENLKKDSLVGYIEYYNDEPVGFIEAFPLDISRMLGFPTSSKSTDGIMITCLSVRQEMSGYGIASRLIEHLEKEVEKRKYKSIEVLSFPDEHNWQPESLYGKRGYKRAKGIKGLCIMKKEL